MAKRTEELDRYFARVFAPDEKYLHTLVSLTRFHAQTADGGYAPVPAPNDSFPSEMSNLHHINPELGKWYTARDWAEVSASPKWLLRKVRASDGIRLLERIDRELLAA